MCPHPFASRDCALVAALLAAPGALLAAIFAASLLLWLRRRGAHALRFGLSLAGVLPTALLASMLVSTLFVRLDLFRSRHDKTAVFAAMLALTLAIEALYVLAVRPGPGRLRASEGGSR